MASSVDGDITLSVAFDTSNIKQDSEKLAKSVQSVFSNYSKDSKSANSALLSLQHQMKKCADELENVRNKQAQLRDERIYSDDYLKLQNELKGYISNLDKTEKKISQLVEKQNELRGQTFDNPQYVDLNNKLETAKGKLETLKQKQIDFFNAQQASGKDTSDIVHLAKYQQFEAQIKRAKDTVNDYTKEIKKLEVANKTTISGEQTTQYQNLSDNISKLKTEYSSMGDKANEVKDKMASMYTTLPIDTTGYENAERKATDLENRLAQLTSRYNDVKGSSKTTSDVIKNSFTRAGEHVKRAFSGLGSVVKKGFSAIGNSAKNVFVKAKNHAADSFKSMSKNAQVSFGKIVKYAFSIRSLYVLFRKLKGYVKEAFSDMIATVPQVRDEMTQLKSSFIQVRNSLATAFQPIFSACVPALLTLSNVLVNVMNTLANFFATLTGQKYIYKAAKGNKTLANSIKGAGKEAKKAKEELAEYDKLIVINRDNATDGGSGSGGSDSGVDGGFEKVATEQNKFAQMIKDAWNKADFTDVGKTIGSKLKSALDSIPWKKIQKGAENAGKSFATLINGITSVDGLFDSAGKTIAEAFNTMFTAIDTFATKLNWKQLGKQLGEFVSSAFFNFDWLKASHTIRTMIGGIATAISSAATTIKTNMPNIIPKIKEGLEDFINNFPVEEVSQAIADVIDVVINFADELIPDIGSLVAKAGKTVMSTIKKINWKGLGTTVHKAISTAIDTAGKLLTADNFSSITKAIGDFLSNINIPNILGKMTKLAINIIKNLAEALKKVNWSEVGKQIGEALKNIASQIPDLVGALWNLAKSIVSGLADALIGLVTSNPLAGAIIAIIGGIKITGIASKLSGLATTIASGLSSVLGESSVVNTISGAFSALFGVAGPIAAVVAAAIAGWNIGKWIYDQVGEYLDAGIEGIDAAVGGPLSRSRKKSAEEDAKQKITNIDLKTNTARAEIKKAKTTEEANKIAHDSYAELSEQIKENYTGALATAEDAELQYKLGLIDETQYQKLLYKALDENKNEVDDFTRAIVVDQIETKIASKEQFKLNTSIKETSESAREATKSFSGMPTEAQNAMKKLQDSTNNTKKAAEDAAKHQEEIYKQRIPTSVQEAQKAQGNLSKSTVDTKKAAEDTAKHFEEMYKQKIPTSVQEAQKAQENLKQSTVDTRKVAEENAKHYEEMYKQKVPSAVQEAQKAQKNLNQSTVDTKKAAEDTAKHFEEMYKQKVPSSVQEAQKKIKELDLDTSKTGENAKASAKHFEDMYNKSISGSAKNAAKDVKKSFGDMGKDIKKSSKSASDNSIKSLNKIKTQTDTKSLSNKFQTAFTNINKSATDSKNKLADNFKKTNDNAKTYTLGSSGDGTGGIAGKFKTASAKAVNWFGTTNFVKPFNDKLKSVNDNVKTKTLGSNGDGTGGLAGFFKSASAKAVNWFGTTNFTKPLNEKLTNTNDNVKTKALGSNGDGTGGLAGIFKTASSKVVGWFNKSNFINPINGEFTQLNSDANDKANGYNGLSSKFATSSSNIIKNLWGVETEANKNGGIFSQLKTNSIPWLRGLTGAFGTAAENMNNNLKGGINASLQGMKGNSFVSKMLSKVLGTINLITSSFSATPVPLATGAVIPPNKEFLALLGDQKQGVNIETPLDTMIEAFRTALATDGGGNNQPIILQLDGKTIAKVVWDANQRRYKQTGNPMFI